MFGANQRQNFRRNILQTVKHSGGNRKDWICFAASEYGQCAVIGSAMNSSSYQSVLHENLRLSVQKLKLNWKCDPHHNNDLKDTSKSTTS